MDAPTDAIGQDTTPGPFPTVVVDNVVVRYRSEMSSDKPSRKRIRRMLELVAPGRRRATVEALKGVSFTVYEGEHLGILGSNGSGKSTLLRVIAGVQQPTSGQVRAAATPVLLGVQAALVQQLSGRRNVMLGLLALGFTPEQAEERLPAVVELAGIGSAINRPMNTYSSGMSARLTFAIAAAAEPEILLIDEALGTGDAAFAKRSEETIERIREQAGTIFLVSHAAQTIETMCTRAIWLHMGEIIADGDAKTVARTYRWWAWNMASNEKDVADKVMQQARDGFLVASMEDQ
ncbi:ABC transporter ATP-binding protein [Luteococcus sp. Sow4_B9]|uniref:ABC transporter ATP-binding protein n=1 Tax=Luteococcus sp. Sow4_B9 TaxID=3438792 RepID=UPI003F9E1334